MNFLLRTPKINCKFKSFHPQSQIMNFAHTSYMSKMSKNKQFHSSYPSAFLIKKNLCLIFVLDLGIFLRLEWRRGRGRLFHSSILSYKELSKKRMRLDPACHGSPTHCNLLLCFRSNELTIRCIFHPQHVCRRNKPLLNRTNHFIVWESFERIKRVSKLYFCFRYHQM